MKPNLFTTIFYDVNEVLDSILKGLLKNHTITNIEMEMIDHTCGDGYIKITFSNCIIVEAYNSFNYFSWLTNGNIKCFDGKTPEYKWLKSRPRKSTTRKLIKEINKFYKEQFNKKAEFFDR